MRETTSGTDGRGAHIFLVAAEESGDRLGAALMRALRDRTGGAVRFSGVGSSQMAREGATSLFPIDDLAIVGFAAIPGRLATILRRIRETAAAVVAAKPDALVIIDSPDFSHRVASKVRSADPSIPIIDYVCPSVWAWRPWRARSMRRYVDHVLALLPFEPAALQRLNGPPGTYVGHPLSDHVGTLRPNADESRRRMSDPPIVLVLPGSRGGELGHMLPVFGDALARAQQSVGALELVLPTIPRLRERIEAGTTAWRVRPRIVVEQHEKEAAFRVARAALTKSGTVTLELALAGVPNVAAYRVSEIEAMIGRLLIRGTDTAILTNLVLGEKLVPEFLQENCTPEKLASALLLIVNEGPERRRQIDGFSRLDEIMEIGRRSPAGSAADIVLAMLRPSMSKFADGTPKL